MEKTKIKLIAGALLHDTGKTLYRYNDGRDHSVSGYEWLKENGVEDEDILDQAKFHHAKHLRDQQLDPDSLGYITYWADNVAAGADRRDAEDGEGLKGFVKDVSLSSVFNILNGNDEKQVYTAGIISDDGEINYPTNEERTITEDVYGRIVANVKDSLKGLEFTGEYVNSLIETLEANLNFIPSSTDSSQLSDISLFDHVKVTAAVASCAYDYLKEKGIHDYRQALFTDGKDFYEEETMLLCSMDISGIQNFIYTIATSRALKNLRARSFYLEILIEHVVDQLLDQLELSRANLLYTGGGHGYLLLPNTETCKSQVATFEKELNQWLQEQFGIDLFMAVGLSACSANDLMNKPGGSYKEIFRNVSKKLSERKTNRYTAEEIITMNRKAHQDHERECKVCRISSRLVNDERCDFCDALEKLAVDMMEKEFIVVVSQKPADSSLPLPGPCYMIMESEGRLLSRIQSDDTYLRSYSKNRRYTGVNVATKLWVGDYKSSKEFSELAMASTGIKRLGVLRADVDNLGQAFVSGFEDKYTSISRTTTFSRKLSMFFKLHINSILMNPAFSLDEDTPDQRNALIVYSGGDDVFLIGAWDDVIGFAIDLNDSLKKYSQETLSISAGVGLFPEKHPVSAMAYETGKLEELAKGHEGKNAIALFNEESVYDWNELVEEVIQEKLDLLRRFFAANTGERGNSMLYRMMEFIRNVEGNKINLARYAYLLARVAPSPDADGEKKALYQEFSKRMYEWIGNEKDRKHLITAIYLYTYLNRKEEA